jgi:hypothetical protein
MEDALMEWVVNVGYLKKISPSPVQLSVELMSTFTKSTLGPQYFTLMEVKQTLGMGFQVWPS